MAVTIPRIVSIQATYDVVGRLQTGQLQLPPSVNMDSWTNNGDGATVTLVLSGPGLPAWCQAQPPAGHIEWPGPGVSGAVVIEQIGSSSSSSSSSSGG